VRKEEEGASKKRKLTFFLSGTPLYLAPEVLSLSMGTTEPSFETATGYGKAVDMWSLGVIL
jgi:serine/threonine protein kinase